MRSPVRSRTTHAVQCACTRSRECLGISERSEGLPSCPASTAEVELVERRNEDNVGPERGARSVTEFMARGHRPAEVIQCIAFWCTA